MMRTRRHPIDRSPGLDAIAAPLGSDPVAGTSVGCLGGTSVRSGYPRRGRDAPILTRRADHPADTEHAFRVGPRGDLGDLGKAAVEIE